MSATPYSLPPATMVMLGVRDVQKSIPFYRDLLGLKLTQQFGGFAFFDAGKIALILSEDRARSAEHVAGATEIVFSVDDIQASYEALKKQGVTFQREPVPITGPMWAAHILDPDGHLLSIFGPERKAS
jgi:catechol 2,3-dioxygenase-like lactoylglutathione lyase family enzyme